MALGAAGGRKVFARYSAGATSVTAWVAHISASGWIALAAYLLTLTLALQTLQGGSVDYDEGVYWQSLRAMADGHPLFGSVFSSQPPLFLLSVYPFYMIFGQSLSAARVALIFFSLAGVTGTYVAGRALGHRTIGAVACLLLALDPLYESATHTLEAELPSIALQIWAVACGALAMGATGRRRGWLAAGAGVLLGCALLMKLFAVVALVPIVFYLNVPLTRRWLDRDGNFRCPPWHLVQQDLRQLAPTLGLFAAGLLGVVALVLLPFVGQLGTVYDQVVRFHLVAADIYRVPLQENLWLLGKMLCTKPTVYIAALAIFVIAWRRMWIAVPLIFWALAAFATLIYLHPLHLHHIVLVTPALALVTGCGAFAAWKAFASPGAWRAGKAITLILLTLAASANLAINFRYNAWANAHLPAMHSLDLATALHSLSAPGEVVLSDDQYVVALADRDVPPQFVDTSAVRIASGYLPATELEGFATSNKIRLILFANGRFDSVPGFRAWVEQRYHPVATFERGGALFARSE